jgi:hypothetical protein
MIAAIVGGHGQAFRKAAPATGDGEQAGFGRPQRYRERMAELVTFKVGEASPANTFFAIWMARDAGFYEANGLKLEFVLVVGG